jgi:hypothetical protein
MAKRNKNVFEPEFRLVMLFPALIIAGIGFIGWGWGKSSMFLRDILMQMALVEYCRS